MSNKFFIPLIRLYDCYQQTETTIWLKGQLRNGSGRGSCAEQGDCYDQKVEGFQVCLGVPVGKNDIGGWHEEFAQHLEPFGPLSVHVKVFSAGAEWFAIHRLLGNKDMMKKIRTFDAMLHFGPDVMNSANFQLSEDILRNSTEVPTEMRAVEWQVALLEAFTEHFAVVGSSLEAAHQHWAPEADCNLQDDCEEQPLICTSGAANLDRMLIGFANKELFL